MLSKIVPEAELGAMTGEPFHSMSEEGVKFFPRTYKMNDGCWAWMLAQLPGVWLFVAEHASESRVGAGLLMYPLPQDGKTTAANTHMPNASQDFPRKFLTPEFPVVFFAIGAALETTKDGCFGQSGCLDMRAGAFAHGADVPISLGSNLSNAVFHVRFLIL